MADITHQIKDEQNDEHEAQSTTAAGCASIGISATAEQGEAE
jgi:hypothetical protein